MCLINYPYKMKQELDRFRHEASDCLHEYKEFRVIFDQPQEELDLLNATAQSFFSMLWNMFLDRIALHISRLADDEVTGRGKKAHKNLSIRALHNTLVESPRYPCDAFLLLAEIERISAGFETWRHKRGAHFSYDEAMGFKSIPLMYLAEVDKFYSLLSEYVDAAYRSIFGDLYPIDAVDTQGVDEVLKALRYASSLRQYDRTHMGLFHQIIGEKLPSTNGRVMALPFCPDCVPAVNGLEITEDPLDSLIKGMVCKQCARHFCQNQQCKRPFDQDTKSVVVPLMIHGMQKATCSVCSCGTSTAQNAASKLRKL